MTKLGDFLDGRKLGQNTSDLDLPARDEEEDYGICTRCGEELDEDGECPECEKEDALRDRAEEWRNEQKERMWRREARNE